MAAQDKKWQAEDDARTLARAREIEQDPSRAQAAKKAAKDLAKKTEEELMNLRKVNGGSKEKKAKKSVPKQKDGW